VQQAHDIKEITIMMNEKTLALAEQIGTSINTLATETDAVRKSQTFLNWLDAMAKSEGDCDSGPLYLRQKGRIRKR